jgi:hypothetical protein
MLKLLVNLNSKLREKIIPTYKMNETEQHIKDVVDLMLKQKDTDVITSPISGKYYISNKRLEYYIMVNDFGVSITNHKFSLEYGAAPQYTSIVIDVVKQYMETDRHKFEQEVFKNRIELLKGIKKSFVNQK